MRIRTSVVAVAASVAIACGATPDRARHTAQGTATSDSIPSSRMPDGRTWTTSNLDIVVAGSYCYDDEELPCRRYGRLYTWESAMKACSSLRGGWRLPSDEEWRALAKAYGGVHDDASDRGRAAYTALVAGGRSGFEALLGGGREPAGGGYARIDAHGFYWTATETGSDTALFYNFARGSTGLYRQPDGEKPRAFSVRCVRE